MPDVTKFNTLTFDCYGTLIDWERGIHAELRPWLDRHGRRDLDDNALLETFGTIEAACEAETPGKLYPEILAEVHRRLADKWSIKATAAEADRVRPVGRPLARLRRQRHLAAVPQALLQARDPLQRRPRLASPAATRSSASSSTASSPPRTSAPTSPACAISSTRWATWSAPSAPRRATSCTPPRASSTTWCRRAPWAWPRCGSTGASRSAAGAPRRRPRPRAR